MSLFELSQEYLTLTKRAKEISDRLDSIKREFSKRVKSRVVVDGTSITRITTSSDRMISKQEAEKRLGKEFLKLHKLIKRISYVQFQVKKINKSKRSK